MRLPSEPVASGWWAESNTESNSLIAIAARRALTPFPSPARETADLVDLPQAKALSQPEA